jgi:hypothetical protein
MDCLLTAGHYLARRDPRLVADLRKALEWMRAHPDAVIAHDQTLMHLAILLGGWRTRNLCRASSPWGSSWAGDYPDALSLIHATNGAGRQRISHIHYSGGWPDGTRPVDVLLLSHLDRKGYNCRMMRDTTRHVSGFNQVSSLIKRAKRRLKR